MLSRPKPGERVTIRYRESLRSLTGLHGKQGTVVICGNGSSVPANYPGFLTVCGKVKRRGPINHLVELEGRLVIVPAGHLFQCHSK